MSNVKKSKKIIATTAVLAVVVCGSVVLANSFAKDGKVELPALSQQAEGSHNGESVSAVSQTGGTIALAQTGDTAAATQINSTASVTQDTTAVVNTAQSTGELLPDEGTNTDQAEQTITTLVQDFGKKLKMVSLLAPKDLVAKSIEENYGSYVTPDLLQKWMANPQSAPGRAVSSPWPDHIGILNIESGNNDQYTVNGELFEVTSMELAKGGAAAKSPITLTVRKTDGRWLINSVTIGDYVKRGPIEYENKKYGFDFYLPKTWEGYTVVEGKWEGRNGADLIETGPQLLIRNPAWTQKDPYQDIPIMIFTTEQWNALQNEKFFVSAAPIGPSVLGSNTEYVFALPPRYNYAFPTGYEEVEKIMSGSPLWPFTPNPDNC